MNRCYIGQRDPRLLHASDEELLTRGSELFGPKFQDIRESATLHKNTFAIGGLIHSLKSQILKLLDRGEALLLDVNFFYEVWNHRKAREHSTVKDINGHDLVVRTVGVYYFKNSWGTQGLGRDFTFMGHKFPGYGMIAMDYAHQQGEFVQMTLNGN